MKGERTEWTVANRDGLCTLTLSHLTVATRKYAIMARLEAAGVFVLYDENPTLHVVARHRIALDLRCLSTREGRYCQETLQRLATEGIFDEAEG